MNKRTARFYNKFAICYPLVDYVLRSQKRQLFKEINNLPEGRLLEIGVGNGRHLKLYNRHEIFGIDTSEAMLDRARRNCPANIVLAQMDGEALSFTDETFDYIVLSHVIAVVDNPDQLLSEVHRVLKPRGRLLILNHFTPANWLRHVDRSLQMIAKLFHFKSDFRLQEENSIGRFTIELDKNLGKAAYFKLMIYRKQ